MLNSKLSYTHLKNKIWYNFEYFNGFLILKNAVRKFMLEIRYLKFQHKGKI